MRLPWDEWEASNEEVENVACKFIFANCYNPQIASIILQKQQDTFCHAQCLLWSCPVPGNGNLEPSMLRG